jgi:hypothetical protein
MSEALDALLFSIRQHSAFRELLAVVPVPEMPRYRPSKGGDLESLGASMAYASGARDQHECWTAILTGSSQKE